MSPQYDDNKWARSCENVSYVICEQQRRRSACASAQSDQHLCCSLLKAYDMYTCYIQSFKILASCCSWAGWFEPYLVKKKTKTHFRVMWLQWKGQDYCYTSRSLAGFCTIKGSFHILLRSPCKQQQNLSHSLTKQTKWNMPPAKTQISLGISPVSSVFDVHLRKVWVLICPLKCMAKTLVRLGMCPWMDELGIYVPFNSISVISEQWKGEHERLCLMKRCLGSEIISPLAGFDPVVRSRKH